MNADSNYEGRTITHKGLAGSEAGGGSLPTACDRNGDQNSVQDAVCQTTPCSQIRNVGRCEKCVQREMVRKLATFSRRYLNMSE
jgi:hypothetical protein